MDVVLKGAETGVSVVVPAVLTDQQVQSAQMVFYHNASTCKPAWARDVFAREDRLKSQERALARLQSALDRGDVLTAKSEMRGIMKRLSDG